MVLKENKNYNLYIFHLKVQPSFHKQMEAVFDWNGHPCSWQIIYTKMFKPQKMIPLHVNPRLFLKKKSSPKFIFQVTVLHFSEGKGLFSQQVIKM